MGQGFEVNEDACDISWLPFSSMHAISGKLIKTSVFEALGFSGIAFVLAYGVLLREKVWIGQEDIHFKSSAIKFFRSRM